MLAAIRKLLLPGRRSASFLTEEAATPIIARKKPFAPQAARIGLYVFLTVSAIFFLLPLLLVAMNSLKNCGAPFRTLAEIKNGGKSNIQLAAPVPPIAPKICAVR